VSVRVAVFASGGGSNLQALLDRFASGAPARIGLVISDRGDAGALQRGRAAGVPVLHIPVAGRPGEEVAGETAAALDAHGIELVALAGYLRLVPAPVIAARPGRIMNIHPALLPAFGGRGMYGRHVHEAVLAAGCRVTGVTVHWVDEHYDEGRIIAQWPVPVLPGDTAASLAARVLRVEHRLYPATVAAVAARLAGAAAPADAAAPDVDAVFRLARGDDALEQEIMGVSAL
jgi:phosphoribosylglycinamide formyltransferase 1